MLGHRPPASLLDLTRTNNHLIMDEGLGLGHCIKVASICVKCDDVKFDIVKCSIVMCDIVKYDIVKCKIIKYDIV